MEINSSKLRLFGFEFDPSQVHISPESSDESVNSSASSTGKPRIGKSPSGGAPPSETKKFECQCCFKRFASSQALGGHQNAHKEGRKRKKTTLPSYSRKNSNNYYGSNSSFKKQMCINFGSHTADLGMLGSYTELSEYILNPQSIEKFSLTQVGRSRKRDERATY